MNWNAKYGVLLLTTTIITYSCGIGIEIVDQKKNREKSGNLKKR